MNVFIFLLLANESHRRRLTGIFRYWGASEKWSPRIFTDEQSFRESISTPASLNDISGIISTSPSDEETCRALSNSNVPFVGFENPDTRILTRRAPVVYVHSDYSAIGKTAVDTFARIGTFKSYVFVHDSAHSEWSVARAREFARFLRTKGITCSEYISQTQSPDDDQRQLADFLRHLPKPIAAFAAWDGRASDVLRVASQAHLKVPAEISILGVDNDDIYCNHSPITLSSIETDMEQAGYFAARELDKLIHRRRRKTGIILVPIRGIVERASTRPPTPSSSMVDRAKAFINAHVGMPLTPTDVATFLHSSRRSLDLAFNRYATQTVSECIAASRLGKAQQLLKGTRLPIRTALKSAGFQNLDYASRYFKRITGQTPSAWRKSHASIPLQRRTFSP